MATPSSEVTQPKKETAKVLVNIASRADFTIQLSYDGENFMLAPNQIVKNLDQSKLGPLPHEVSSLIVK